MYKVIYYSGRHYVRLIGVFNTKSEAMAVRDLYAKKSKEAFCCVEPCRL